METMEIEAVSPKPKVSREASQWKGTRFHLYLVKGVR